MKFYGKAETAASRILTLFREPNRLPEALAPMFIHRSDDVPCRAWSWSNQLLTALSGTSDARGFRQWESVGRHVKKGSRAFYILGPCTKKIRDRDPETGAERDRMAIVGFKSIPVFRYEDTDGEALPGPDGDVRRFLDGLPLLPVAESWGLSVDAFNGRDGRALGWYRSDGAIALGVENLSTWAHELCHAADDRLGALRPSSRPDREVVAELGGAVLLQCLGNLADADLGGCWQYIESWAQHGKVHPIRACERLLKRVCDCVALILDTANDLQAVETGKKVA